VSKTTTKQHFLNLSSSCVSNTVRCAYNETPPVSYMVTRIHW